MEQDRSPHVCALLGVSLVGQKEGWQKNEGKKMF
jgi:hypothetical protein